MIGPIPVQEITAGLGSISVFVSDPSDVQLIAVPIYVGLAFLWNLATYSETLTKSPQGWSYQKAAKTLYGGAIIGLFVAILEPALLGQPEVAALTGLAIPMLDELFGLFANLRAQVAHNQRPEWSIDWLK